MAPCTAGQARRAGSDGAACPGGEYVERPGMHATCTAPPTRAPGIHPVATLTNGRPVFTVCTVSTPTCATTCTAAFPAGCSPARPQLCLCPTLPLFPWLRTSPEWQGKSKGVHSSPIALPAYRPSQPAVQLLTAMHRTPSTMCFLPLPTVSMLCLNTWNLSRAPLRSFCAALSLPRHRRPPTNQHPAAL